MRRRKSEKEKESGERVRKRKRAEKEWGKRKRAEKECLIALFLRSLSEIVPRTGFEPAHDCSRCDLNTVRLPISPPGQVCVRGANIINKRVTTQ